MIRKDVIIAVLATFCLTSTLFMVTTSKSQSGVGEYNPWADYNGDGTIDIFDIVPGAVSFGAEGDPTKNVNVTNWPLAWNFTTYSQKTTKTIVVEVNKTIYVRTTPPIVPILVGAFDTDGFDQVSLFFKIVPTEGQPHNCTNLYMYLSFSARNITGASFMGITIDVTVPRQGSMTKEWCSPNAELYVVVSSPDYSEGYYDFTVVAYLMA